MTVTWNAPKHCGGSKVNAYYVDRRNADKLQWKEVNLSGLQESICTVSHAPLRQSQPASSPF